MYEFRAFIFSDGTRAEFKTNTKEAEFKEEILNPADACVRRVIIYYYHNDYDSSERMNGIQFLDKDNESILRAGYWSADSCFKEHRIDLKEGERILGVKSGRRNQDKAYHYDV